MEAIIMNPNYDTLAIIDSFRSFIWTERYNTYGDFELQLLADTPYIEYLKSDNYVYRKGSDKLMIIETVEIKTDVQDGNYLIVSGRSLESILNRRIVWDYTIMNGNFQTNMFRLLNANIIKPSNEKRTIPYFNYIESKNADITSLTIKDEYYGENLYDIISKKCIENDLGFKIEIDYSPEVPIMLFQFYKGVDRSYRQDINPWVVFSPKMENLINTDYIVSRNNLKTAALVTVSGSEPNRLKTEVMSEDMDFSGLARREVFVNSGVNDSGIEDVDASKFGTPEDRVNVNDYGYSYEYLDYFREDDYNYAKNNCFPVSKSDFMVYRTETVAPDQDPAYLAALAAAQAQITAEYNAAVASVEAARARVRETLRSKGLEELNNHKTIESFDGDIEVGYQYTVGKDYWLGDVVQLVNEYGIEGTCRITEVMYSQDEGGIKVIPSFQSL